MSDVAVAREGSTIPADIRLASAIAAGDLEAFVALMRRFNGRLYRTARSIVPNDLGAEGAVESAWLLAHRTIGNFNGETSLSIWLMRIVIGEAHVRLRKGRTPASNATSTSCGPDAVKRKRTPASKVNPASAGHESAR